MGEDYKRCSERWTVVLSCCQGLWSASTNIAKTLQRTMSSMSQKILSDSECRVCEGIRPQALCAIEFCRAHSITLISFPPHPTHRLQPLDFRPLI